MRILLNGAPMMGRLTGIGQYGLGLLEALAALPRQFGLEAVGVFDGREVRPVEQFLAALRGRRPAGGGSRLKQIVRRAWPGCRDWADRLRRQRLASQTRHAHWSLFHETNFVSPQFALPLVTTVHDMSYLRCPEFLPKDRLAWLRRRMNRSLAVSRVIITDSRFTRDELLELCPQVDAERVFVTHLGVDLDYFSDPTHAGRIDEVRAKLGLPRRFVLYLGTLEPRKNLQGLLRGYCRLPEALQREYPLVLAGMPGWNQSYFRRDLDGLRRCNALFEVGYVDSGDVPPLMKAASVFCFPSLYEGFGLPPLEAAACGTPVLSSRVASLPEVLGDAAWYVDPRSPDEIAAGLQRLLEDGSLAQRLAAAGRARAALFPWKNCARQTLAAYQAAA
ncbi:MAG TPA: glycosyltransferase family 1 protein [Pirellulales bacterium]|nr:glycosyltransferase family 1 protein [Pirellulales bacterium]